MKESRFFKAFIACFTVVTFLTTSVIWAPNGFAAAQTINVPAPAIPEVSIPHQARLDPNIRFSIPQELGTLQYFKPGKGPMVVHLQTAHGHYQAQKQIQALLHHLDKQYDIRTILVEGSAFKLQPEILNFFPEDPTLTQKVNDALTKAALVKGPELYLLDKLGETSRPEQATAYGIENLEAYRKNGVAFVNVLTEKKKTENFLITMSEGIDRLAAAYLNDTLRGYLRRLESFEKGQMPFEAWLSFVKKEALKQLKLDLIQPGAQLDWPMLVRIFKVQELSSKFNQEAFVKEKGTFLKKIGGFFPRNVKNSSLSEITSLLNSQSQSIQLPALETHRLFEDMVKALPRDFNYEAYPNVCYFIGRLLLQSELKTQELMEETQRLSAKIADKLAKTQAEKDLVALLKDYRLLQKLFALELTPADYDQVLGKRKAEGGERLKPSQLVKQLNNAILHPSSGIRRVKDVRFMHVEELDRLFALAMEFYAGVKERDGLMEQMIEKRLQETGADKVAVITGGFHSEPFKNYFSSKDYSYALISPRIAGSDNKGHEAYVQNMLHFSEGGKRMGDGASRFSPSATHHPSSSLQNSATRELEFLSDPQVLNGNMYGINAAAIRSEVRQIVSEVAGRAAPLQTVDQSLQPTAEIVAKVPASRSEAREKKKLGFWEMREVAPERIGAIPADLIPALTRLHLLALTEKQVKAFTAAQIQALTPAQFHVLKGTEQEKWLNARANELLAQQAAAMKKSRSEARTEEEPVTISRRLFVLWGGAAAAGGLLGVACRSIAGPSKISAVKMISFSSHLTSADLIGFPEMPNLFTMIFNPGGATVQILGDDQGRGMHFAYNTGTDGYVGAGLEFFLPGVKDSANLSSLNELRFELHGNVPGDKVKMDVIDADSKKAIVYLTSISTIEGRIWQIPVSTLQGVNMAQIRDINFVAEGPQNFNGELHVKYNKPSPVAAMNVIQVSASRSEARALPSEERRIRLLYFSDWDIAGVVGAAGEFFDAGWTGGAAGLTNLLRGAETERELLAKLGASWNIPNPSRSSRSETRNNGIKERLEPVFKAFHFDDASAKTPLRRMLNEAMRWYIEGMTRQHIVPKGTQAVDPDGPYAKIRVRDARGSLDKVNASGNAVVTAMMADKELEAHGVYQRASLDGNKKKYLAAALRTLLTWYTLDGGIGENLVRKRWLENRGLRARLKKILSAGKKADTKYQKTLTALRNAEERGESADILLALRELERLAGFKEPLQINMGAKGTDLGRDETIRGNEYFVGDAESRLLFLTDPEIRKQFGKIILRPIVNYQSKASYEQLLKQPHLWDVIEGRDKPRSYEQALRDAGVEFPEMLDMPDLPKFEIEPGETVGFPTTDAEHPGKKQTGGHGQPGIYFIVDFTENAPPMDGLHHVLFFSNGDNRPAVPDPVVIGFVSVEKKPILKVTTPATAIDKKGGKEVLRIIQMLIHGVKRVFNVLDQWEEIDATAAGQARIFYAAGQRNGFGKAGKQLFNTNMFYFNFDALHPILHKMREIVGPDEFLDGIMPFLFDKSGKAQVIEGKKYVSMDSAIGYLVHKLNTFYVTDPRFEDLRKQYGPQLLYYLNGDRSHFGPKKGAEDQYLQEGTDFYSPFDEKVKNFRQAEAGLVPPGFAFTDPIEENGKHSDTKFWSEAQHWLDSLGFSRIRRLTSFHAEGRFTLQSGEYVGDIVIINRFGRTDPSKPATRVVLSSGKYLQELKDLGYWAGDHLKLENVQIMIDEKGELRVESVRAVRTEEGALKAKDTEAAAHMFSLVQEQGITVDVGKGFQIKNGGEMTIDIGPEQLGATSLHIGDHVVINGVTVNLHLGGKNIVNIKSGTEFGGLYGLKLDLFLNEGDHLRADPGVLQEVIRKLREESTDPRGEILYKYTAHLNSGEFYEAFYIRKIMESLISSAGQDRELAKREPVLINNAKWVKARIDNVEESATAARKRSEMRDDQMDERHVAVIEAGMKELENLYGREWDKNGNPKRIPSSLVERQIRELQRVIINSQRALFYQGWIGHEAELPAILAVAPIQTAYEVYRAASNVQPLTTLPTAPSMETTTQNVFRFFYGVSPQRQEDITQRAEFQDYRDALLNGKIDAEREGLQAKREAFARTYARQLRFLEQTALWLPLEEVQWMLLAKRPPQEDEERNKIPIRIVAERTVPAEAGAEEARQLQIEFFAVFLKNILTQRTPEGQKIPVTPGALLSEAKALLTTLRATAASQRSEVRENEFKFAAASTQKAKGQETVPDVVAVYRNGGRIVGTFSIPVTQEAGKRTYTIEFFDNKKGTSFFHERTVQFSVTLDKRGILREVWDVETKIREDVATSHELNAIDERLIKVLPGELKAFLVSKIGRPWSAELFKASPAVSGQIGPATVKPEAVPSAIRFEMVDERLKPDIQWSDSERGSFTPEVFEAMKYWTPVLYTFRQGKADVTHAKELREIHWGQRGSFELPVAARLLKEIALARTVPQIDALTKADLAEVMTVLQTAVVDGRTIESSGVTARGKEHYAQLELLANSRDLLKVLLKKLKQTYEIESQRAPTQTQRPDVLPPRRSELRLSNFSDVITPEEITLIEHFYFSILPMQLRELIEAAGGREAVLEALRKIPGVTVSETAVDIPETSALDELFAPEASLAIPETAGRGLAVAKTVIPAVKNLGGKVFLGQDILTRLMAENPRALFYLLKTYAVFVQQNESPVLLTVGSPDLISRIKDALINRNSGLRGLEISERAALLEALEAGKILEVIEPAQGVSEAQVISREAAKTDGGIASLHLSAAMIPGSTKGVHFAFGENVGARDLMVASVFAIVLKSAADLIRNIPDADAKVELLNKFFRENLPGVQMQQQGNNSFVITQMTKLAQEFAARAYIATRA